MCNRISFLYHRNYYIIANRIQRTVDTDRTDAVGYIIEHVDEFRDEINAMGYEVRVAYTWADIWKEKYEEDERFNKQKKLGTEDRGILILFTDREEYVFDVGFDYCDINLKDGNKIYMSKDIVMKMRFLDLKDRWLVILFTCQYRGRMLKIGNIPVIIIALILLSIQME